MAKRVAALREFMPSLWWMGQIVVARLGLLHRGLGVRRSLLMIAAAAVREAKHHQPPYPSRKVAALLGQGAGLPPERIATLNLPLHAGEYRGGTHGLDPRRVEDLVIARYQRARATPFLR
jgi:hypothetical protein